MDMARGTGAGTVRGATRRMRTDMPAAGTGGTAGVARTATETATAAKAKIKKSPDYELLGFLGRLFTTVKKSGLIAADQRAAFIRVCREHWRKDHPPVLAWAEHETSEIGGERNPTG